MSTERKSEREQQIATWETKVNKLTKEAADNPGAAAAKLEEARKIRQEKLAPLYAERSKDP